MIDRQPPVADIVRRAGFISGCVLTTGGTPVAHLESLPGLQLLRHR